MPLTHSGALSAFIAVWVRRRRHSCQTIAAAIARPSSSVRLLYPVFGPTSGR